MTKIGRFPLQKATNCYKLTKAIISLPWKLLKGIETTEQL